MKQFMIYKLSINSAIFYTFIDNPRFVYKFLVCFIVDLLVEAPMRMPKIPPSVEELIKVVDPRKMTAWTTPEVQELIGRINDRYMHWDELRFRVPAGMTLEETWLAVVFSRMPMRQTVPLSFVSAGAKLHFTSPPKHLEHLHHLDKQGGGAIGVSANSPLEDESDRYLFSSLMEEAIASSQLEGASTTRKVAKSMLRANRKPQTEGERMIVNNYRAILEVRELKKEKLTPEMLCRLQSVLTEGTLEDGSGRFRHADEQIHVIDTSTSEILHVPPPATEIGWRLKEICSFANEVSNPFIHPVVKAAILHFAMGYLHPFVDGNGRTARALFYWYMLKRDYWLFEYFPISKAMLKSPGKYGRAYLFSETDRGDLTYFIRYNLHAIMSAMREFYAYVAKESQEAREAAELLESFPGLNHRQRDLIHDALKNNEPSYTFSSHQGTYHVTYPTARTDLLGLVKLGLINEERSGKTRLFRPASNLRELLHLSPAECSPTAKEKRLPKPIAVTVKSPAGEESASQPNTQESNRQPDLFD